MHPGAVFKTPRFYLGYRFILYFFHMPINNSKTVLDFALFDTNATTPHASINSQLIRVLSVAWTFAMYMYRSNNRLWRGQESDIGDAWSFLRRYECNDEAPPRSHFRWLAYRYVLGPICKCSNQIEVPAPRWVADRSANMHAVDKLLPCEWATIRWCLMSAAEFTTKTCPEHSCYGLCEILVSFCCINNSKM